MQYIPNILFGILLIVGFGLFFKGMREIYNNINLGRPINRSDRKPERWKTMARVALGQGKMTKKPIAGILHIFVYLGFLFVNIELIEIFVDGLFGTHRFLAGILGHTLYNVLTGVLEVMAFLVIIGVVIFYIRRNIVNVRRLVMKELKGWPHDDANWILIIEFLLMAAFFVMNTSDWVLQTRGVLPEHGYFPISQHLLAPLFEGMGSNGLAIAERAAWWFHIVGVFFFMNYLYYSKHLHILFAFPNTWFSKLEPKGEFTNLESVTNEVKMMMDPNADPYAMPEESESEEEPERFGAKDVFDLSKVQLLNAYSCTECGRCTDVCPANMTGKLLSPRKIMMSTRDRIEDVGANIKKNGKFVDDGKSLLNDYITPEELWACTTCNACVEACPVLIDPMSIIVEMRRYLVMEESAAPQELNLMMSNIENNGAPWQYNQADRLKWAEED